MSTKNKVLLLTIAVAIPAFILGPILWPNAQDMLPPTSGQLPFFIIISALEAIVFALGISFILFGRTLAKSAHASMATFWSIAWLLVSWWPHDNFHRFNGHDNQGLLYIEYGFHLTLFIAGLIIASDALKRWKSSH